jgi:hypothetical protein
MQIFNKHKMFIKIMAIIKNNNNNPKFLGIKVLNWKLMHRILLLKIFIEQLLSYIKTSNKMKAFMITRIKAHKIRYKFQLINWILKL